MPTYKAIQTLTVGAGGASSITFSSIPQTYTDLVLKCSVRENGSGSTWTQFAIRPNNVNTNQTDKYLYGTGSAAGSAGGSEIESWANDGSSTSNTFASAEFYIPNYTSSNYKSFSTDGVTENNSSSALATLVASLWSNTSAITSIVIVPSGSYSFVQYSSFTLYGIKKS